MRPVDLILLDLRMPMLDGLETLRPPPTDRQRYSGDHRHRLRRTGPRRRRGDEARGHRPTVQALDASWTYAGWSRTWSSDTRPGAADPDPRPAEGRTAPAVAQGQPAVDLTAVKVAMDRRDFDQATSPARSGDRHPPGCPRGPRGCRACCSNAGAWTMQPTTSTGERWQWTPTTSTRRPACDATAPGSASMLTTPGSTRLLGDDFGSRQLCQIHNTG